MKLAEAWNQDALSVAPVPIFHDEGEELDEVDETEDGCGGVKWQPYVLTKPHTSYRLLHELAREVRGTEQRRGKNLTGAQYRAIFDKWELASKLFLRPRRDYFTEFLAKLDCVTVPKGETLEAAFQRARHREPPVKVSMIRNESLRLFASLCRELHEMAGDQPIMLHQVSIASLFGHPHWRNVGNWIKALKSLEVLQLAEPAVQKAKAARYLYLD